MSIQKLNEGYEHTERYYSQALQVPHSHSNLSLLSFPKGREILYGTFVSRVPINVFNGFFPQGMLRPNLTPQKSYKTTLEGVTVEQGILTNT